MLVERHGSSLKINTNLLLPQGKANFYVRTQKSEMYLGPRQTSMIELTLEINVTSISNCNAH